MGQSRHFRAALSVLACVATLTAGCGAADQTTAAPISISRVPTTSTSRVPTTSTSRVPTTSTASAPTLPAGSPAKSRHGGRGDAPSGSSAAAGALPTDWPPDLPLPAGEIRGSKGSKGRWTVLIVAAGPAAQVLRSAAATYVAAGFTAVSDSVLNKGNRQVTLVVENLDHSATQTNLMIGVTTRPAG